MPMSLRKIPLAVVLSWSRSALLIASAAESNDCDCDGDANCAGSIPPSSTHTHTLWISLGSGGGLVCKLMFCIRSRARLCLPTRPFRS